MIKTNATHYLACSRRAGAYLYGEDFFDTTYPVLLVKNETKGYVEERIWALFTPKQKEVLRKFKHQADKISIIGIIKYVCTKYPHMAKGMEVPENFLD